MTSFFVGLLDYYSRYFAAKYTSGILTDGSHKCAMRWRRRRMERTGGMRINEHTWCIILPSVLHEYESAIQLWEDQRPQKYDYLFCGTSPAVSTSLLRESLLWVLQTGGRPKGYTMATQLAWLNARKTFYLCPPALSSTYMLEALRWCTRWFVELRKSS